MTESEAYFIAHLIDGLGPVKAARLKERFGSLDKAITARGADLRGIEGIGNDMVSKITSWQEIDADKERKWAEQLGVQIVTQADKEYPASLREIYDPPLVLYIKGTIPETWPRGVAVVGSRETSHYGLETAKKLGYQIAYAGVPVISGLARGIDTAAHLGALAAKGVTWAALGCGLDKMYPPENDTLAAKIVESGGCLISELSLGTAPDKRTFPMRNRIVAGLSFGVLVIEGRAAERGAHHRAAGARPGAAGLRRAGGALIIRWRRAAISSSRTARNWSRVWRTSSANSSFSSSARTRRSRDRCPRIFPATRKKSTRRSSSTRRRSMRSRGPRDCRAARFHRRCCGWR